MTEKEFILQEYKFADGTTVVIDKIFKKGDKDEAMDHIGEIALFFDNYCSLPFIDNLRSYNTSWDYPFHGDNNMYTFCATLKVKQPEPEWYGAHNAHLANHLVGKEVEVSDNYWEIIGNVNCKVRRLKKIKKGFRIFRVSDGYSWDFIRPIKPKPKPEDILIVDGRKYKLVEKT